MKLLCIIAVLILSIGEVYAQATLGAPTNLDGAINVIVVNNTANSMNIFPFLATDVIVSNGVAAAAGAALAVGTLKNADCWASTSLGRWYCTVG